MASTPYHTTASVGVAPDVDILTIPVFACSAIANADELAAYTIGTNFEVLKIDFVCVTPITTAAKTATLTPYIGSTAIPGTVTALAGTKAKGSVTNVFTASATSKLYGGVTDTFKLTGSAVTAFVEGAGYFLVQYRNLGNNA